MWISVSKIVLWLYFCISVAYSYHSKLDYIKLQEKYYRNSRNSVTITTPKPVKSDLYEKLKLRHQSRFSNTDRDMTFGSLHPSVIKNSVSSGYHKHRHSGSRHTTTTTTTTTDEGLFGDYGDFEYDEEETNGNYWEDEDGNVLEYDEDDDGPDDDDDDTFYDDDLFSDSEWQAEEATESTTSTTTTTSTTMTPSPYRAPVSSLTEYKWDRYGTRARIEESRRAELHLRPNNNQRAVHAVVAHYLKIRHEGQCKKPFPRVIPVQSIHPNPRKTYTPHCTILHRCAEDTGCCSNYAQKCGPKTQQEISLYFYTKTVGSSDTKVEMLTFFNHTECECMEKSKVPLPLVILSGESSTNHVPLQSASQTKNTAPENEERCRCPEEFSPRFGHSTGCMCICEDGNEDCDRMKRGQEYLSLTDRKCILDEFCGLPVCEYGAYIRAIGRCPRKQDKFEEFERLNRNSQ